MSADVDPEVKGQAKPAGNVDPEVERLARVMHDGETEQGGRNENHPFGEGICLNEWEYGGTCRDLWTQQAAAVLADLRERYVLVPREGGDPEFGVRMDYAHPFVEQGAVLRAVDQEHADLIAESWDANGWEHTIVRRVRGPWEPADAPLSAQNGPDDSQGTDAHPENPR